MTHYLLRRRKLGLGSCRGIKAVSNQGLTFFRNDRELPTTAGYIFRWGCTSEVPRNQGTTIINQAAAIHEVNDKLGFRHILNEAELCPKTWFIYGQVPDDVIAAGVVVRPKRHAQGRQLFVCRSPRALQHACTRLGMDNYYISELINKVAEYRVFVISGRAVAVANKTPGNPQDVAWNVNRGGSFSNVSWDDWPLRVVRIAIEAFNLSSLDFGGVDVMVDADGGVTVLEINSAPSLTSPYRQECFAKTFDYIITHGKEHIPLVPERGGYRKFIHPAVCEGAKLLR